MNSFSENGDVMPSEKECIHVGNNKKKLTKHNGGDAEQSFKELEIRISLTTCTWKFSGISYFQI
jgi:hypothetical protein